MLESKPLTIKELPQDERPREKMLLYGAQNLSNAELIAILLRTGTHQETVLRLAERLLVKGGLIGLGNMSVQEMSKTKGIGPVKAVTIAAAIELGKRLARENYSDRPVIHSPQDAAMLVMARLRYETREHFIVLLLNIKNHVLATPVISVGSLSATIVDPRELFREAINYSAASVILVHNHPSGDPTPSQEDISLTKKLLSAGDLLDIKVLDHIIIGDGKYLSMKDKGII